MFLFQHLRKETLGEGSIFSIHANIIDQSNVFYQAVSFLELDFFPVLVVLDIFTKEVKVVNRLADDFEVFALLRFDPREGSVDFGLGRFGVSFDNMSENVVLVQRMVFF